MPTPAPAPRATIAAWCLYDWANSAFTTLVVTFIYSAYFTSAFADDPGRGTALWSRGVVVSALAIAVLAPLAGTRADRGGRRRFLIVCSLVCVAATAALTFVRPGPPNAVVLALALFVVANVAFEIGLVFYNAFLPSIAEPARIGRISGYGWSLGYAGGLAALVAALVVCVSDPPMFGIPTAEGFNLRATNLLVAGWFLLFAVPAFVRLRDPAGSARGGGSVADAFRDIVATARRLRQYRQVLRFLLARLFYNDGLVTIFAFGGIYAVGTFGFTFQELLTFGIVINVGAGLGALAFGFVDDRLGGKVTVGLSVAALAAATLLGALAPTPAWFWASAILVGVFAGPNQSASRSLMARFVPARHESEFFGFFAFSGKVTSFLGPALLGVLSEAYSQRVGVASLLVFFAIGGLLLWRVDERRGIEAAAGGGQESAA
ncbi:MAG: MFS transporter [Acidobacteria bacterium]|nr:MFS transporter [Acidobacteriota bacterium]